MAADGIGSMHRGQPYDVPADLPDLAKTPVAVVCTRDKAILAQPKSRILVARNGFEEGARRRRRHH